MKERIIIESENSNITTYVGGNVKITFPDGTTTNAYIHEMVSDGGPFRLAITCENNSLNKIKTPTYDSNTTNEPRQD